MTITSTLAGPIIALAVVLPATLKLTEPPRPTALEVLISAKLDRMAETLKTKDCPDHPTTKGE